MERNEPGVASNQEIRFTTPSGVTVAGRTVVLNYPSGFNLSSVAFGDVDLFYGATTGLENEATIAATSGVNIWGVTISGRKITFVAPTNAGPVSAADKVVIRVGTNATGGVNRIVNPGGGGGAPVFLAINGTFGDTAGMEIPIYTNDAISVTATVAAPPPPSGGGSGGGSVDGTAPVISNIRVINITQSSATVLWDTDEPANGRVRYGLATSTYTGSVNDASFITSHSLNLTGLSEDTIYHFQLGSADAAGNDASTGDLTFRTLPPPAPPVISNVLVINITDTTAIVTWQTDVAATSLVEYGLTSGYGGVIDEATRVTNHSVFLSGLTPNRLYHFRVSSTQIDGLSSASPDGTFTTLPDATPPANVFNFIATPGDGGNTLTWTNPADADFVFVRIRARTDGYPTGPADGRFVYQGSASAFMDLGLVNGTTYYYANYAYDADGNRASGALASATPLGTLPPPPLPPAPPVIPPSIPPVSPPSGSPTTTPPLPPTTTTTPPVPPTATSTPPVIVPTSTQPGIPSLLQIFPQYYAGNGSILLPEDASGAITSGIGLPILVRVSTAGLGSQPSGATIEINGLRYALTLLPGGESWGASFIPANRTGRVPATVVVRFPDGTEARASTIINVQGFGRILGRDGLSPVTHPLEAAVVTLYQLTPSGWQIWNGARFGQTNPAVTGKNGVYGFLVQNGDYRIRVERQGYVTLEKTFTVTRNILSSDLVLASEITIPVIGPIISAIQSEQAQEVVSVAAPVVIAIAVANLAMAASAFSILNYLWFLLTQPFILLGRKKRERWGIVYNSLSKAPVDLVAVRLIHAKTNLILQTRITDAKGRFSFRVRPGQYRLEATRQGYRYPSAYMKGVTEDGEYLDVYQGQIVSVEEESSITVNIPLDPDVKEQPSRTVIFKHWLRRFQSFVSSISVFVTLGALIISPSLLMLGMLIGQILVYLLFHRLAAAGKPKGWGIVYDAGTRRPIGQTVVRIFDKKFNKLLETQVTDRRGSYGFFAQKNVYFMTADKPGYSKYKSEDIDLAKQDSKTIDRHIKLDPERK